MISLILAASRNGVIGSHGRLPWHLPDDLRRFKALTIGKPVVMGRKTYESIGRPLPQRRNIVVTRRPDYRAPGCDVVSSPDAALQVAGAADEIMIIGGSEIYAAFLPLADRIYLTRVHADVDGDARFVMPDENDWQTKSSESRAADEAHAYDFEFVTLDRRDSRQL